MPDAIGAPATRSSGAANLPAQPTSAPGSRSTSPARRQGSVPLPNTLPTNRVGKLLLKRQANLAGNRSAFWRHLSPPRNMTQCRSPATATSEKEPEWHSVVQGGTDCGGAAGALGAFLTRQRGLSAAARCRQPPAGVSLPGQTREMAAAGRPTA